MGCSNTKLKSKEYKSTTKGNQVGSEVEQTTDNQAPPEKKLRSMKGDLVQRRDAKKDREKKLKEKRNKTIQKAMFMSDKIMDERERLSLTSSRATSRAGTPATDRKNRSAIFPLTVENGSVPPSEADEDNYNTKNVDKHNGGIANGHVPRQKCDDEKLGNGHATNLFNGSVVHNRESEGRTSNNNNNDGGGGEKVEKDDVQNISGVEITTVDSPRDDT